MPTLVARCEQCDTQHFVQMPETLARDVFVCGQCSHVTALENPEYEPPVEPDAPETPPAPPPSPKRRR